MNDTPDEMNNQSDSENNASHESAAHNAASGAINALTVIPPSLGMEDLNFFHPKNKTAMVFNAIENAIGHARNKTIHFVSANDGEGAGSIAFESAYAAATNMEMRILFIDMSDEDQGSVRNLKRMVKISLDVLLKAGHDRASPFVVFEDTNLFYAPLHGYGQNLNMQNLKGLLDGLKAEFDYIITYSGSALSNGSAIRFAEIADATVLVIEAEKTRLPVAKRLKETIESNGGLVIGSVMNKRRLYIPKWIYKLLFKGEG